MSCASSGHITKLKQSIFAPFDIYGGPSQILDLAKTALRELFLEWRMGKKKKVSLKISFSEMFFNMTSEVEKTTPNLDIFDVSRQNPRVWNSTY
jgi:hypothetical protein